MSDILRYKNQLSARYFDFEMRNKTQAEVRFYLGYLSKSSGPVLDLACGTGRLSIEFARNGFAVDSIDLSKYMLDEFEKKLEMESSEVRRNIRIIIGDISNFDLGANYPLIILPQSFQALTNRQSALDCLRCVSNHLQEGGKFIINISKAPADKIDERCISQRWKLWETIENGSKISKYIQVTGADPGNKTIRYSCVYEKGNTDGTVEDVEDTIFLKYYTYGDFRDILTINGFSIIEEYGTYEKGPIEMGNELIFVCAKKHDSLS